jgi:hypothetical protein
MQTESIVCRACSKTYTKYAAFKKHISLGRCKGSIVDKEAPEPKTKQAKKVTCHRCNKQFQCQYNLNRHMKTACKNMKLKALTSDPVVELLLDVIVKLTTNPESKA